MIKNVLNKFGFVRVAFVASVGFPLIFAANAFAQLPAPAQPAPAPAGGTAEVERVIVTGSNIPTAEETGPNPVDTYRPQDMEKLGIKTAQDLVNFLPQEAGGNVNLNIGNAGDGSVQLLLPMAAAEECSSTVEHWDERAVVLTDGSPNRPRLRSVSGKAG